ncbi:MAG: hypothetical protein CBD77_04180 [bacterium TMED217]|nr:MAG: hypothetical protein CBD77_04180 [bacterium TMED217]
MTFIKKIKKIIFYFSRYFSIAMPDANMIIDARNNFGSISFGYLIITPIGIENMPRNCSDFAM